MKIKLEATSEKSAARERAGPQWYVRTISLPVWAHIAVLAVVLGLGFLIAILIPPINRAPKIPASAAFVKTDATTEGNWKGVYGAGGFALANDLKRMPSFARVVLPGKGSNTTWVEHTEDPRALQHAEDSSRTAAAWYANGGSNIDFDIQLRDDKTHHVALYFVDWDSEARIERVQILDPDDQKPIDLQQATRFNRGIYLVWGITGHVLVRITPVAGANGVVSGLFLD
jgi:hypothetical protein